MSDAAAAPIPAGSLDTLFERARPTRYTWLVLALGIAVTMAEGAGLASLASVAPLAAKHYGLSANEMGLLLAATLVGSVLASYLLSPVADRFGRRMAIIGGLMLTCVSSAAAIFAPDSTWLLVARFSAGIGVGMTTPALLALMAETVPARLRAMATMVATGGFVVGAALSNVMVGALVDDIGFRVAFIVAGATELIVALLCIAALPESPFFLTRTNAAADRIGKLAARLGAPVDPRTKRFHVREDVGDRNAVRALFTQPHRLPTLLFWLANLCTLGAQYLLSTWLPTLLVRAGDEMAPALNFIAITMVTGSVFSFVIAGLSTRINPTRILMVGYAGLALGFAALGLITYEGLAFYAVLLLVLTIGPTVQFCLIAVVSRYYSSGIRATGVGYALGAGRIGGVLAPLLGGMLVTLDLSINQIMGILIVPVLLAGVAMFILLSRQGFHDAEHRSD